MQKPSVLLVDMETMHPLMGFPFSSRTVPLNNTVCEEACVPFVLDWQKALTEKVERAQINKRGSR